MYSIIKFIGNLKTLIIISLFGTSSSSRFQIRKFKINLKNNYDLCFGFFEDS
jgi:hypothetical protein